ncbi:glycerophosphodiester phosphodiesterase [Paenibacillus pinihumi]|uniref:glycerophosphodiester phosphodiesterase n=1 Tax=Paenibacillus pinihumi TaxID=669462 RepID=UPI00041DB0F2|nr:glycerophosphodiester phosphodiesterase [Paenibacillus pinihumi]
MNYPLIIAHTGGENTPYNTLLSAQAGRRAGAELLEVDVRVTKDLVCILSHDEEPGFSQYTYEELTRNGRRLERLDTVLKAFKGDSVQFNLDLKTTFSADPAIALIHSLDMWEQIYFTGDTQAIESSPYANRVVKNVPEYDGVADGDYEQWVQQLCAQATERGFAGLNVHYEACTPTLTRLAHASDIIIWIYTLPCQEELFALYAGMGVDAISVFEVTEFVSMRQLSLQHE